MVTRFPAPAASSFVALALLVGWIGCTKNQANPCPEGSTAPQCSETTPDACPDFNPLRNPYVGELHVFVDCLGVGADAVVLAVTNADGDIEATIEFQFGGAVDQVLLDQMLATFALGA